MKTVLEWLGAIERSAHDLYDDAARYFSGDAAFASFLARLADDEAHHLELISQAIGELESSGTFPDSAVVIDAEIRRRTEEPFEECRASLRRPGTSRTEFLSNLVEVEFAAWNDVFLYALRACRPHSRTIQRLASAVQEHADRVESYLASSPMDVMLACRVRDLPSIWDRRVLVVDDEDALRDLYVELLSSTATVDTARDGQEGLDRVRRVHYDAIVSDCTMPEMDGLRFFTLAVEEIPDVAHRFVFCSADPSDGVVSACGEHGLDLLRKPFAYTAITRAVEAAIRRAGSASPPRG
jgi:CheY-like chemotaxis protein/rubrerythrin